jgi:hypothetical protein
MDNGAVTCAFESNPEREPKQADQRLILHLQNAVPAVVVKESDRANLEVPRLGHRMDMPRRDERAGVVMPLVSQDPERGWLPHPVVGSSGIANAPYGDIFSFDPPESDAAPSNAYQEHRRVKASLPGEK